MAGLIILRGNSGSGKTTIAKELQKKLGSNTLLISQDVIRREMLMVSDGPDTMALPMLIIINQGYRNGYVSNCITRVQKMV